MPSGDRSLQRAGNGASETEALVGARTTVHSGGLTGAQSRRLLPCAE